MVELLDDEWARKHGGAVLYEETGEDMRARKVKDICIIAVLIAMGAFLILLAIFLFRRDESDHYCVLSVSFIGAAILISIAYLGVREANAIVPFRIQEEGVLLGRRKGFLRFGDIFRVEEATTADGKKVTAITPVGATPVWFVAGEEPVSKIFAVVHSKDYDLISDILRRKAYEKGADILTWDESAMALMERVEFVKSPAMASAEKVAKRKGIDRIDARFLVKNSGEIARGLGIYGERFLIKARETEKRWRESWRR